MTETTPIKSLADARTWLGTLSPGQTVAVGPSLFDPSAKLVAQLFALLPGDDAVSLTVTAVDPQQATLAGRATVLGEAGSSAAFAFTQPASELLATLTLTPPETLQWTLLSDLHVGFGGLQATLAPDPDVGVVTMRFAATALAGTTGELAVPLQLSVPSYDGDWIATAGDVKIGSITADALGALAGGTDLTAILPSELADLSKLTLTGLELAFDPIAGTCSFLRLGIDYAGDWKFFGDHFAIDAIDLEFEVLGPLSDPTVHATLSATMQIDGGPPFDVGGQFPDKVAFARLHEGAAVSVTNTFAFFGVDLPQGFPDIEISRLGFVLYTASDAFEFYLGIDRPVPLIGDAALDSFLFDLNCAFDPGTKALTAKGTVAGQLSFGQTHVLLSGSYASGGGLTLAGHATDVGIGALVAKLGTEFGITSIPSAISDLKLQSIDASLDTAAKSFTFACAARTTIAGVDVDFNPSIAVTDGADGFSATFDGSLVIHVPARGGAPAKDLEFDYSLIDDSKGCRISAVFKDPGDGLQFADLAAALDLDLPTIPDGLELDLQQIGLGYDFTNQILSFEARSKNYGAAALVVLKDTSGWEFFFGIDIDRTISLSDLPLIGKDLAQVVSVSIDGISVLISSDVKGPTAVRMNTALDALGRGFPRLPAAGMSGVALSMTFDAGGDKTVLSISTGTSASGDATRGGQRRLASGPVSGEVLEATDVPGASAASVGLPPSPDTGTVWLPIQQTFGPVAFQKVGIRYRDSQLSFLMNASLSVGGLTIAVMGLGAGSELTDFVPKFTIDGLAVTYAEGPVLLSGALVGSLDPVDFYGELMLGMEQLQIGALGGYCEVEGHPSFFLYAVLDYPIGGPAFFFVTGLAAGFGFNRRLVIPPVDGVATFPLVQWASGGGNPPPMDTGGVADAVTKAVTELSEAGVVAPSVGDNWLALGVRFSSFELVDSFALLTAAFGTEFEIALLGLSTVQVPPAPAPAVAKAQLALEAAFIPSQGVLSLSGQLTPESFVLSPDAHLTGGFALMTWFSGDLEGQFVVTLGGYSPRFTPPPGYPTVPRLGLDWRVTPQLEIRGDLYFALTSSAVMAGGGLSAVWSSGDLRAWFDVEADFLIVFQPFHYYISAGIHLGASFTIDLWFTKLSVSIHVGVELEVWGPEFAGEARIDLSIISFTIRFGDADHQPEKKIAWADFVKTLLPSAPKEQLGLEPRLGALTATDAAPPAVIQIVPQRGVTKRLSDAEGELNWVVDGETLQLATTSAIPTKDWSLSPNVAFADGTPDTNVDFGVGPVDVADGDLESTHAITVTSTEASTFLAEPLTKNVATALWQQRKLDDHGVPTKVDPLNDTTIDGVAVGTTLTPHVAPPDHTLPIKLVDLEYTIADPIKPLAWSDGVAPKSDPFTDQTVAGTITAAGPTAVRGALITELAADGWPLSVTVDVAELAKPDDLVAEPVLRHLGEQR